MTLNEAKYALTVNYNDIMGFARRLDIHEPTSAEVVEAAQLVGNIFRDTPGVTESSDLIVTALKDGAEYEMKDRREATRLLLTVLEEAM